MSVSIFLIYLIMKTTLSTLLFFTLISFKALSQAPTTANHAFDSMLQDLLSHSVPELSVSDCPSPSEAVFLDARAKSEYEVSHISGATWIGFTAFQKKALKQIDKDAPIVVYCSVGYRSEKITEKLRNMGYKNVSNLYGGIFAWKNQGKTVVDPELEHKRKISRLSSQVSTCIVG